MYTCDQCGNRYSRLSELNRHKRYVHKPLLATQCSYFDNFTCDHCGKNFKISQSWINILWQSITTIRICGNWYSRLSELSKHKRYVHKPLLAKAIQCSYFGKDLHRNNFLSAHVLRVHKQVDIFNCVKWNKNIRRPLLPPFLGLLIEARTPIGSNGTPFLCFG